MAAHDKTRATQLTGKERAIFFTVLVGAVPAALATAELAGRTGNDVLRAVALGYHVGTRLIISLGLGAHGRNSPSCLSTMFIAAASCGRERLEAAAMRAIDIGARTYGSRQAAYSAATLRQAAPASLRSLKEVYAA